MLRFRSVSLRIDEKTVQETKAYVTMNQTSYVWRYANMNLQRPTRSTLVEQVASQLEKLIEEGQWPVGERIPPEPELVEKLGVSRNTIREAIRALIHAGLLRTRQGDGTYVVASSSLGPVLQRRMERSKLSETLEVRAALEQEAARLAAQRRTADDIKQIQITLGACGAAEQSGDMEAYITADLAFHKQVIVAAHNRLLSELYDSISESVTNSLSLASFRWDLVRVHSQLNERLLEAITCQDSAEAGETVRSYIQASQDALLDLTEGGNTEHHE